MTPTAYLLAGLTGSGKTTFARKLEAEGVTRLSIDEEVFDRNGRYAIDYPNYEYPQRERPVVNEVRARLVELIRSGRDVVLDHGLWLRSERDDYKRLVTDAGGQWRLIYFAVDRDELWRRLAERNQRDGANALRVPANELESFIARFEPPSREGEELRPQ